jgi:hypothetical protein
VEVRLFRCYVQMLPRLRAEEELAEIQHGHAFVERPMQQQARGQYIASLEQQRSGERQSRKRLDKSSLGVLAGMGIPVKRQGDGAG